MGIFKKLFKGIKKFVKKIGKGIKKVVKKVQKGIGKLGIVGQIGMMFLMPYAMGAMSGFFGQFAAGQAGTWAAKLASSNVFGAKALSTVMNAVHSVGSFVGQGVAGLKKGLGDTISGAVDWIAEKTGTTDLVKGARAFIESGRQKGRELFGKKAVGKTGGKYIPFEDLTEEGMSVIRNATPKQMDQILNVGLEEWVFAGDPSEWPSGSLFKSGAGDPSIFGTRSRVGTPPFRPETGTGVATGVTETEREQWGAYDPEEGFSSKRGGEVASLLEPTTSFAPDPDEPSFGSRVWESIKDHAEGQIKSSVQAKLKRGASEAILGPEPPQRIIQDVRRNYLDLADNTTGPSLVNGFNDFYAMAGNSWQGSNLLNYDAVKAAGNDGTADYELAMRGIEQLTLPPQQRVA